MRIIKPSVELLTEVKGTNMLEQIELAGRTCYKSENKITDNSAIEFVKMLVSRGHEAMLEHADLCFEADGNSFSLFSSVLSTLVNRYGFVNMLRKTVCEGRMLVSGNVRAWRDFIKASQKYGYKVFIPVLKNPHYNGLFDDVFTSQSGKDAENANVLNFIPIDIMLTNNEQFTELEYKTHKTISMKFTCDRGVSHEIVRHRLFSFAQESTRYCNYSQDKFDNQITVIEPYFFTQATAWKSQNYAVWEKSCKWAEDAYFELLRCGALPQEARSVLPNSLKTEIVVTGNVQEWLHFADLRTPPTAHPQMRQVAIPAMEVLSEILPKYFGSYNVHLVENLPCTVL